MKAPPENLIRTIGFSMTKLHVHLTDGRSLVVPLFWYPTLFYATTKQKNNWKLIAKGRGINWPDIDEDLSVEGMLRIDAGPVNILKGLPERLKAIRNEYLLGTRVRMPHLSEEITGIIHENREHILHVWYWDWSWKNIDVFKKNVRFICTLEDMRQDLQEEAQRIQHEE